jgi:hypothetical protein
LSHSAKKEIKLLVQKVHLAMTEYIDFLTMEDKGVENKQSDIAQEKLKYIKTLLVNTSYYINKLRRK